MMQWFFFRHGAGVVKDALVTAWGWVSANALWLLLLAIGAFTGAKLLRRKDSQVATLNDALLVEKHKTAIEGLRARRDEVLAADDKSLERDAVRIAAAKLLEDTITEHKQRIAELHKKVNVLDLTDEQVEEVFKNAGL